MQHIFTRSKAMTVRAVDLRNSATQAERRLWPQLSRNAMGCKFRRQHVFGAYILDFYCTSLKLAVELDGARHGSDDARRYDEARTRWLEERGVTVLRFWNREVFQSLPSVCDRIFDEARNIKMRHDLVAKGKIEP